MKSIIGKTPRAESLDHGDTENQFESSGYRRCRSDAPRFCAAAFPIKANDHSEAIRPSHLFIENSRCYGE